MRWLATLAILALAAGAGWGVFQYARYRGCGERACAPAADDPAIRLASGAEVRVISTREDEGRRLVIDYLTLNDREDLRALCEEAREVWQVVSGTLNTRLLERATLGPTSPQSEFLGMKYLVLPLYTCCVSTYLRVEKDHSGGWVFPECPS